MYSAARYNVEDSQFEVDKTLSVNKSCVIPKSGQSKGINYRDDIWEHQAKTTWLSFSLLTAVICDAIFVRGFDK